MIQFSFNKYFYFTCHVLYHYFQEIWSNISLTEPSGKENLNEDFFYKYKNIKYNFEYTQSSTNHTYEVNFDVLCL